MTAHPLGRHVHHDPRSLDYPASAAATLTTVQHHRRCRPYNQGNLGSCTGNAMAGLLMTDPAYKPGRVLGETAAITLYSQATRLDQTRGVYPPDDTGSSGLAVAHAARNAGYITGYRHAFGLDHALGALVLGPVIVGIPWYEGFDKPQPDGECRIAGTIRGGHEIVADGIDVEAKRVWLTQSWGDWGPLHGRFCWTFDTFDQLLHDHGDVVAAA